MNANDKALEDVYEQISKVQKMIRNQGFFNPYADLDDLQKELEQLEATYEKLYDFAAADPTSDHYNGE